ncbi:MAG: hypothetical protein ACO3A4_01340 [Silvanigrellaceae bacterium]
MTNTAVQAFRQFTTFRARPGNRLPNARRLTVFVFASCALFSNRGKGADGLPRSGNPVSDASVSFDSIRLKIDFDSRLFDSAGDAVQNEQMNTACKVWTEAFKREQGPWGYGIASDVACRIKKPGDTKAFDQLKSFDNWLLTIAKDTTDNNNIIVATICRLKKNYALASGKDEKQEERCEARKSIPWTDFKVRLLRHRAFVRLFAASLVDQLPFMSVVTRNLIRFDVLGIKGFPEAASVEVEFPPPPASTAFFDVRFEPYESKFRIKEVPMKEAIYRAMNQNGVTWILNKAGRGERANLFSQKLQEAFVTLTTQFQFDVLKFERERIKSDVEKLKAISSIDSSFRGQFFAGVPSFSQKSAYAGEVEIAFKSGAGYGARLQMGGLKSKHAVGTLVQENDDPNKSVVAQVNLDEFDFVLEPVLFRRWNKNSPSSMIYQLGSRIGFVTSSGDFVSEGNLPQNQLSLSMKEFVLGLGLGIELPIGQSFEISTSSAFDFGLAAKSTKFAASAELNWILSKMPVFVGGTRQARWKLGAVSRFQSLGRRFVTSGTSRNVETLATLNGIQGGLFLERNF